MEGYLREKELKTCIWGKESIVVIDEDIKISKNVVVSKLSWIEEHKDEIIEFALAAENFLDGINNYISETVAKKGKCKLPDGTILQNIIEEETLIKSIFVHNNFPLYYFPLYAEYLPSGRSFISPVLYASTRRFTASACLRSSAPSSVSITSILVLRVSTVFMLGLKNF